jgi:hypothetical protein
MMASLVNCSYTIVSTGGTASALESAGVSVTKVEQLTSFPEMVSISVLAKLLLNFLSTNLCTNVVVTMFFRIWLFAKGKSCRLANQSRGSDMFYMELQCVVQLLSSLWILSVEFYCFSHIVKK